MEAPPTTLEALRGQALRDVLRCGIDLWTADRCTAGVSSAILLLCRHLSGRELAGVACVCKYLRDFVAAEDQLWQERCAEELAMEAPVAVATRALLPTYREAYHGWQRALGSYGELGRRAWRAWATVEAWLEEHSPVVGASLRPGASEEDLGSAERQLGMALPPALRVLYRVHDGQQLPFDDMMDSQRTTMDPSVFGGLFGGCVGAMAGSGALGPATRGPAFFYAPTLPSPRRSYGFYNHMVSTRFLPLRRMLRWTPEMCNQGTGAHQGTLVLFAASYNFNKVRAAS